MASFEPQRFDDVALRQNNIDTAFGVPDTNLSGFLTYLNATKSVSKHIVTANEGAAVALAAGYHLSTNRIAVVYMQNSGLANALNPLQSIAAREVFGIPMLLLIGWRGQSGEKEELQDALVGPRLLGNLETNGIPYEHIPTCVHQAKHAVERLIAKSILEKTPVALLVPRDTFAEYHIDEPREFPAIAVGSRDMQDWTSYAPLQLPLSREGAIRCVVNQMSRGDISVSSLGGISREYYMIKKETKQPITKNFFCIGAMGHVYALSFGVSIGYTSGRIFCIDGDGSFLMHAGNNAILASLAQPKLIHVVIYNGVHASTGNHPLAMRRENLVSLVRGFPYEQKFFVDDVGGLVKACRESSKSTLIVVAVNILAKPDLPAPSETLQELKSLFVKSLL